MESRRKRELKAIEERFYRISFDSKRDSEGHKLTIVDINTTTVAGVEDLIYSNRPRCRSLSKMKIEIFLSARSPLVFDHLNTVN